MFRVIALSKGLKLLLHLLKYWKKFIFQADGADWVYENHITSRHELTALGQVSHIRRMNVTIRCRYPMTEHVHSIYNVHSEQMAFRQDSSGQFPVQ